jgi:hypothetical protein
MRRFATAILALAAAAAAPALAAEPSPEGVTRSYFALIGGHHYAAARRASGAEVPLARFIAAFRPYRTYHAAVGRAGEGEGAAGSTYVEVPVRIYGRLRSGRPYSERGSVTIRRVNDIPGASAAERRWHIYRIDVPPSFE